MIPYIFLFIVGIIFGSFYNVVADRLPNNESIIKPRSHCPNCNHVLKWYELIPLISFIIQRGKCRKCYYKMSIWYFLSELLTGLLFCLSYYLFGFSYITLESIVIMSVIIITIISDIKYMIILDSPLVVGTILLIIIELYFQDIKVVLTNLISGLIMFLILLIVKLIGDKVFKQESLGWGDVKFSFFAGFVLNIPIALIYLFLAAFIALPNALYQSLKKGNSVTPFGPFLAISLFLLYTYFNQVNYLIGIWLNI